MNAISENRKFKTQEQRWSALAGRNKAADGRFVYGVRTTGVYCRASCHSRMPNRENVEFFDSALQAEQAGFRPCKRCRPDAPAVHPHLKRMRKACRLIEQAESEPSLTQLASAVAMSPFHFQ